MANNVQGQVQKPADAAVGQANVGDTVAGQPAEKKSKLWLWIVIILVLIVVGLGIWFWLK